MNKLSLFLVIAILCIGTVSALEMSPTYSTNTIIKGVQNSINLTLNIMNAPTGTYNLYTLADISINPSGTFKITNGSATKHFTITPMTDLNVNGYYSFSYILNHRGVEKIAKRMVINLMPLEDSVEIGSDSIDPESGKVSFYVKNKESTSLKNLTASFSSILFNTEKTFNLGPNEKLIFNVNVGANKLKRTKAGVYVLKSVFKTKNGEKKINGNLYIGEKKGITSTEDTSGFLIRTETVTKVNVGNVLANVKVEITKNIFSRLFTTFNIEPTLIERKGLLVNYIWVKDELNPAEAYVVKAKTNYIFPFFVIIFAALVLFGFKRFSETKIELEKSVSHVKTKNGEFALKVTLSMKAKKNVENVTLIDKIPAIVKIYKKFGMVKPDKIDAENRRIHWHIGDLNEGEERVFTYIVYSKVGIVGKFSLPEAVSVFEKDGKIYEVNSNRVFFMSDQIHGD